jgi:glycosyltransferase involved in cell wall biosynthesis
MGDYLHTRGWQVIGIGTAGAKSAPPAWRVLEANAPARAGDGAKSPATTLRAAMIMVLGVVPALLASAIVAAVGLVLVLLRPAWGHRAFRASRNLLDPVATFDKTCTYGALWLSARLPGDAAERELERLYPQLGAMRELALLHGRCGLWIANDWMMLPLAAEGARRLGGAYVYDSHEFATQEFAQRWDWRLFRQPVVKRVERRYIGGARVVTAVSRHITEALRKAYGLTAPTTTLRNMPAYQEQPFHPVGAEVRVLYHGVLTPDRGLEAAIDSLTGWPDGFSLTIRGPGEAAYIAGLSEQAERRGVHHRLTIEPPLPMGGLVAAAAAYDVGLLALPGHSKHNAYALPNKVYEYLMAGLALCVTDLPAMAEVVRETGAGVLCGHGGAGAIADAMQALVPDGINTMKANALAAARHLHFEADAKPVEQLYLQVL